MGSPFLPALMSTAIYYKRNTQYYYKLDNYREFVSVSLGLFPISAIFVQQSPFTYTHVKVITKRDISMGRTPVLKNVFDHLESDWYCCGWVCYSQGIIDIYIFVHFCKFALTE